MVVELGVQLQQLADMQSALEAASRQPHQPPPSALKATRPSNSGGGGGGAGAASASRRSQKGGGSSGGGSADSGSGGLRPMWGFFGCKSKSKKQMDLSPDSPEQQQQQQQQGSGPHQFAKMGGPVVVVFVSEEPQLLDGGLLGQLPVSMGLGLPGLEGREELLMGWLMEREAAVNVNDVEALAR
jgi:hypothetical protein